MKFAKRILIQLFLVLLSTHSFSQENKNSFEIYGFITGDAGYNFNSINPDWFDVMRPTKLPKYQNEFAPEGNVFFSIRQTRFGVRNSLYTRKGELKTQFDFDLFGFGVNAGQTTFHLINAFGEIGDWLIGQTSSAFMDLSVFPVTLDYWGPMTRIFNFNIQVRYTPIHNEKQRLAFAIERPGATADESPYSNSIELKNVKPYFNLPNLTGHFRQAFKWGYVQIAGVAKSMKWRDISDSSVYHLSGSAFGWGMNLNTVIQAVNKVRIKFQGVYGKGIENYIADAPADIGVQSNHGIPLQPVKGKALPVLGFFSFVEIIWNKKVQSSIGYSMEKIDNSDLQLPDAFRKGQYGLVNLRYYPVNNLMMGIEYQYGRRNNFTDGFHSIANKVQLSCKFNFSNKLLMEK